jgi:hypothetical protein
MTRSREELVEEIARHYAPEVPTKPLSDLEMRRLGKAASTLPEVLDEPIGAALDLERMLNRLRDRLTPAQLVPADTTTLPQNSAVRLAFGREVRSVIVQNNTDLSTAIDITMSLDATPAGKGDYRIRAGQERQWDVYAREVWLFQSDSATALQVNNPGAIGIVVLAAV